MSGRVALRWVFKTIPQPGEFGYDTWPADAWTHIGGANAWSGISVDTTRGLVFLPTGSAAFDFWGGNRHGQNLFANSLLALKAATGERVWHYQFVHHDLWDRDLPSAPVLVTVNHRGGRVDAVAQTTKSGHVFLFNRETGVPLFPIEEHPVPASDLKGESAWPTQPLPVKPPAFSRQAFTETDVTDVSEASRAAVLAQLAKVRTGRQFIPPSAQGTVIFPGFDGGAEWGGAAFDADSGFLYVNGNEMPWILVHGRDRPHQREHRLRSRAPYLSTQLHRLPRGRQAGRPRESVPLARDPSEEDAEGRGRQDHRWRQRSSCRPFRLSPTRERREVLAFLYNDKPAVSTDDDEPMAPGVPYTHTGYNRFLDPEGYPAVKPPWGTMNAIDLNKGEIAWQVPLGEEPALVKRGRRHTGTENYGGPIITAGGLIFIGATKDEKFRALDKRTGQVLWEAQLPAGGYATPSTYVVNGKQYVVIAAGGGKMGTKSGDAYVAYALPGLGVVSDKVVHCATLGKREHGG